MYTADELEIRCALAGSPRAEQLIACLEGEIAKRDEELAACRVAVENCEVFRARIAELEAKYLELASLSSRISVELPIAYALPVSEAKAQGVVQWPEADEIMQMAFEEGQPADDASGYCFELEEFDLFIERLMSEVARLNAAPVQQPKCKTCDDNGRIGGPSFYAPDEGGYPCPDCCAPVQQVSVPECFTKLLHHAHGMTLGADWNKGTMASYHREPLGEAVVQCQAWLAAAPSAPAADAGIVDMYRHLQKVTPYRFKKIQDASITDGGDVMYFHKDRFDAALLADMAAHRAKGVV